MENQKKALVTFYNIYLAMLSTLASLPILAPLLLKLGLVAPAKFIYLLYSFFCHQFATRSIYLYDFQYAWCSRDTGIWLSVALVAWLLKLKKLKPIKWYWVIPFVIPIALDGGIQTIFTMLNISNTGGLIDAPLYASNNLVRFLTGSFFGIGLSLWISGTFIEEIQGFKVDQLAKDIKNSTQVKRILATFGVLIVVYLFLVSLWSFTGNKVLPTDFADSSVKLQDKNFFERRTDGVCATKDSADLFNFECFFN